MTPPSSIDVSPAAPPRSGKPRQPADAAGARQGDTVPTLMCSDAAYLQHSAVCLVSLLANNPDLFFQIVYVGRASEHLDEARLRRSLANFPNHSLTFKIFVPPQNILLPLNPRAKYTLDSWARLWVADFFDEEVDRVLYLDGDIVVVGSIAELWRSDLEGQVLGAVDIPGAEIGVTRLGLRREDGYFNSGVLLIDLKRWRQQGTLQTLLDYIAKHPEQMMFTVDQDALNACLYAQKKRLDGKWNAVWTFFQQSEPLPVSRTASEAVRRDARIIHFNHAVKPWSYFCEHPRRGEYSKYLKMTDWRDFAPPDRTLLNRVRKALATILPQPVKRAARAVLGR